MAQMVRFVDRPGGTVLFDVSPTVSSTIKLGDPGASFPPPPVDRQVAQNPVRDGGSVSASHYGLRTIKLPLVYTAGVVATPQESRRTAVRALMRVLDAQTAWLEVRPDGVAESRYLRTYRPDTELLLKLQGLGDRWAEFELTLLADPFAYGPKETLGTLTFTQAARSKVTVSGSTVKGDVPAPLICTFTSSGDSFAYSTYVATKRGGGVHSTYVDMTAGGGTPPGASTRTTVASGIAIGGSYLKWDNVTEGQTILMAEGVVVSNAGAGDVKLRGTYRVLFVGQSDASHVDDIWEADLRLVNPATWVFAAEEVKLGSVAVMRPQSAVFTTDEWADMGLIEVPFGGRPLAAGFDAATSISPLTLRVYLTALNLGATPSTHGLDGLIVLPADDELMVMQYADAGVARTFIVDPHSGQVIVKQAGVNVPDVARVGYQGAPPMVVPGLDVDIYSVRMRGGLGAQKLSATTLYDTSWVADYWPRYLTVA